MNITIDGVSVEIRYKRKSVKVSNIPDEPKATEGYIIEGLDDTFPKLFAVKLYHELWEIREFHTGKALGRQGCTRDAATRSTINYLTANNGALKRWAVKCVTFEQHAWNWINR